MAASSGPKINNDQLKLALDAADVSSYPGSGTPWYDLSSNGFNGTLMGGVGYSSANFGIMVLDGVDDHIQAPSVNAMGAMPNQTFEIWVKSSGLGPSQTLGGLICLNYYQRSHIQPAGAVFYQIISSDSPAGTPGTGSTTLFSLTSTGINCFDNNWHHIVCTRNDSNAVIYIDGISRASGSGGGAWSGGTLSPGQNAEIGKDPNNWSIYNLMGNIALARIYSKSLTATEVLQNYNAFKPRFKLN